MAVEKAVLIGIKWPRVSLDWVEESLFELSELCETAGAVVAGSVVQHRGEPDPRCYVGRGKLIEIRDEFTPQGVTLAVFNDEPSPAQIRNIEADLGMRVLTRTEIILDIFALHARSSISKLQVELAQLNYRLPRIMGKGADMMRQKGGIGMRGPGEQQLEIDRRRIRERIHKIKLKLQEAATGQETRRRNRLEHEFKVAIVGYTNAGKSSLLNRLTRSDVLVEDRLFATLDTTTRRLWLSDDVTVVLTDTVGFIRDIPHALIESFRSTLEDTVRADLLLFVVDGSNREHEDQYRVARETLYGILGREPDGILVFNKIDLMTPEALVALRFAHPQALFISAGENRNIDALKDVIRDSARKFLSKRSSESR